MAEPWLNWTEKYRPKTLEDIEGNSKAVEGLENWALRWKSGRLSKKDKKAVILVGAPGTGKTSAAIALGNDMGWSVVEMNASDSRNADSIRKVALLGAISETFTSKGEFLETKSGGRKLIILDEADNVFGKEDYGGLQSIVEAIRETRQPIILVANDYYELTRRSSAIRELCLTIEFKRLREESVRTVLRKIASAEGIKVEGDVIDTIIANAAGDLRSAINDFQSVAQGRNEVRREDISSIGHRDLKKSVFSSLIEIYKATTCKKAREGVFNLDESPDRVILWVDENLPLEYRDSEDMLRGFEALSRADIYLGRVERLQNYVLWSYALDMMTSGVAMARRRMYSSGAQYQFPGWLRKMGQLRGLRASQSALLAKLGKFTHTSKDVARMDTYPYFKFMYASNHDFKLNISALLDLNEEEIGYLIDEKPDSHPVKHVVEEVKKLGESEKKEKTVEEREDGEQRSLLHF